MKNIETVCQLKSLSAICFYIFCSSLILLFCISFDSKNNSDFVNGFIFLFCAFTVIYIVVAWIFGEKGVNCSWLKFYLLKHSIVSIIVNTFLSLIFGYLFKMFTNNEWLLCGKYLFVICAILFFVNYVVYSIIIKCNGTKAKKQIDGNVTKLMEECGILNERVKELMTVDKVRCDLIKVDDES